ncbi:unnamed protein product [Nezara viridula]|uniref:Uncharacterized protein n=1 Tax=Nezara viridula TaxID=85310 RepID=A0A9P0MNL5_NEZVI|nr:unnamed protein product [Nezara viridula]
MRVALGGCRATGQSLGSSLPPSFNFITFPRIEGAQKSRGVFIKRDIYSFLVGGKGTQFRVIVPSASTQSNSPSHISPLSDHADTKMSTAGHIPGYGRQNGVAWLRMTGRRAWTILQHFFPSPMTGRFPSRELGVPVPLPLLHRKRFLP